MANIPASEEASSAARRVRGRRPAVAPARTRAVLLDALGTLVSLEPPWIGLRRSLGEAVPKDRLIEAVAAEMRFYRDHCQEGRDERTLAELRERCAALLSEELGQEVSAGTLVSSLRFEAFADARPALDALRARGLRLVCVSNWDVSLHQVLEHCHLAPALDAAVSSAEAGASKPDPAIFARALELAGCAPGEALHVGDSADTDIAGAAAAGIRALRIDREGGGDIASLSEVAVHA